MQLQPRRPPGRVGRKAAVYASEIVRLRGDGYTYEAIREALADVGVLVSASAVQRELQRATRHRVEPSRPPRVARPEPVGDQTPAAQTSQNPTGRELAEAFFIAHPSNPLLNSRERS